MLPITKSQQSWIRSQHPPTHKWNMRGGRWNCVESNNDRRRESPAKNEKSCIQMFDGTLSYISVCTLLYSIYNTVYQLLRISTQIVESNYVAGCLIWVKLISDGGGGWGGGGRKSPLIPLAFTPSTLFKGNGQNKRIRNLSLYTGLMSAH